MDLPASTLTPEEYQDLGAQAFDDGRAENDHDLTDRTAIKDWQCGWHARRVERSRLSGDQVQQLAQVSPP